MTAADRTPTALPGVGILVPVRMAAVLADALRCSAVPELRVIAAAALEVAADYTDRTLRASASGRTMTVADAAKLLRCTPGRVRQLLRSGQLEGDTGPGGIWQVKRASVDRRIREGTRAGIGSRAAS